MYKQIIIARKDLEMSPGKLSAQVSHASMAFLTRQIQKSSNVKFDDLNDLDTKYYEANLIIDKDLYEQWIDAAFTKVILRAKNKNDLLKCVKLANELGLEEDKDYFLIKDNCYTELEPEEYDEFNVGRCLTCIGFRPLDVELANKISKKYQLYK